MDATQVLVFLAAAVFSVPIAKRLGLGSVLGYLLAGILIGPFGLGLVGDEVGDVMHFAELGVVMMLFLIGLELQPSLLWRMRKPILGLGGSQVALSTLVLFAVATSFGLRWQPALAIGLVLALSSTAIVLQTLQEKNIMRTAGGQSSFAVLLFQDIAVIPMIALLPLLATARPAQSVDPHHASWTAQLPQWAQMLIVPASIALIILGGHYAAKPAFRWIARTRTREIFVAAALLLVLGIELLMTQVGLSPALGTFLAGVLLANSEYRHQIEADVEPFKGLLLGLFFLAIGASIDFHLVAAQPLLVGALVITLMALKFLILAGLGKLFGIGLDQRLLFAFALAQGGEFAFVLFTLATRSGVLESSLTALLIVVVAISMALTPLSLLVFERLIRPRVGTRTIRPEYDDIDESNPVILCGFGRVGQICARILDAEGVGMTVLEYDSDQVELLRKFGRRVFYGDATRLDLLESAGAGSAQVIILALDQPDKVLQVTHLVQEHFPHLKVIARARGRVAAYDLIEAGVTHVFRETFDSALSMGVCGLELLGHRAYRAQRVSNRFRKRDTALLRALAGQHRQEHYFTQAKRANAEAEATLKHDIQRGAPSVDHGWDAESLVEEFGSQQAPERAQNQ